MPTKQDLLFRLNEIGLSLKNSGHGLALIGLGSVGKELDRLDEFSDLDFFAIVENGFKNHFISNIDWLSSVHPISYLFRNTSDGYKLLFDDGIFCEMAVFEQHELEHIPFAEGRIIWKVDWIDESIKTPKHISNSPEQKSKEWMIGEAITCLYVGLGRFHRGEKLSAYKFIQHYAVDRIIELSNLIEIEQSTFKDQFASERRFEIRFPEISNHLPDFIQGYDKSPESAKAILEFLDGHFDLNEAMKKQILKMC